MAQEKVEMELIKQVLQLYNDGVSIHEIKRRTGVSRNSIKKYLKLIGPSAGRVMDDAELAEKAYCSALSPREIQLETLFKYFRSTETELSKTGVTRLLLWQEYLGLHPGGYSYPQYCYHLQQYNRKSDVSMHLEYTAGDIIMIDFAGKKMHYIDQQTGECIYCQVFVSILPYSGLIYCIPVHTQRTDDFAHCINNMVCFYKGVTSTILCDNLKTAVTRSDKYEPGFTEICYQLSEHYGTTFTATRPYSPRDKAMVEKAVSIVYSHVYAPLRKKEFYSLRALEAAMHEQLSILNKKSYKNTVFSRIYYFEQEQPFLKLLPPVPFVAKKVKIYTVQRNYHIQLTEDRRYYSVPWQHVGKKVKVLYDQQTVEIYLDHDRIAVHQRNQARQKSYVTQDQHMHPDHQKMKEIKGWKKDELLQKAAVIGKNTHSVLSVLLEGGVFIEQNYKACFGLLMLKNKYTAPRLEAACKRALSGTRITYSMIKNILRAGLDKQLPLFDPGSSILPDHTNIRGKDSYQ